MSDLALHLSPTQAVLLHKVLTEAEDNAAEATGFLYLAEQGSDQRRLFLNLLVELGTLNTIALRRLSK